MRRLVLFAHYDAQGEIKRYIAHLVRALRAESDRVDLYSTAALAPAAIESLREVCADVVLCENVGFDFSMWRRAIARTDLDAWDEIVLANSSVFGPIYPLGPLFAQMAEQPCDAWGMTENDDFAWHLQSFFLVFRRPVLESAIFRQFWESVLPYKDKDQVIRSYEIGLSRLLLDHGFRLRTFAPTEELEIPGASPIFNGLGDSLFARARSRRLNPTCGYPLPLLRAGMPFVKVEVLRDNPIGVDLEPLRAAMEGAGYDLSMLEFDRPPKLGASTPPQEPPSRKRWPLGGA